jgi:hypothetical protein
MKAKTPNGLHCAINGLAMDLAVPTEGLTMAKQHEISIASVLAFLTLLLPSPLWAEGFPAVSVTR